MNEKVTNEMKEIANKCLKQVKNRLYFNHKSLSPAIYRMPIEFLDAGCGIFGTDATQIYADPMNIIIRYKKSPEEMMRVYLHMLFHCIYLHPFVSNKKGIDETVWNIAMDICAEAAVMRLIDDDKNKSFSIDGDDDRKHILDAIKAKVKMFIPEILYKELMSGNYELYDLLALFHMDEHLWMNGNSGSGNGNGKGDSKNNGDDNDDQNDNQNGGGSGNKNRDQNQQNRGNSNQNQQKKQEWSDVSRQIAADMQSFHQQGKNAGSTIQEIDYLTQDKMDYEEFLRQFSVMEEKMKINMDEFDYMYYTYGLSMPGNKKKLLIEPLEYKDEKVVKEFVIAIDTSGSCSGELVKRFLNKTYSILKESESFASRVNIHIVQCDARVQNDAKITNMEDMERFMKSMKLYGFGGTDFRPVFQYVDDLIKKKEFTNLCGLIYFTDGYGTYPTKPTPYKTAFAFLEDYNQRDVPPWALSVYWKDEE